MGTLQEIAKKATDLGFIVEEGDGDCKEYQFHFLNTSIWKSDDNGWVVAHLEDDIYKGHRFIRSLSDALMVAWCLERREWKEVVS